MKEVIQDYGQALLRISAFSLVLFLLLAGCCFWGRLARAAEYCDESLLKEEKGESTAATERALNRREENVRMESTLTAKVGEKYCYSGGDGKTFFTIHGQCPKVMKVLNVYYCNRDREWDVTDQVRFTSGKEGLEWLCFNRKGCYRLTVYTDDWQGVQETWNIYMNVTRGEVSG